MFFRNINMISAIDDVFLAFTAGYFKKIKGPHTRAFLKILHSQIFAYYDDFVEGSAQHRAHIYYHCGAYTLGAAAISAFAGNSAGCFSVQPLCVERGGYVARSFNSRA